jgi:uncharacterized protein YndB with AHSA1/START domain
MASIKKEIRIAAPPARVWDAVRDFGAVHQRLVPGVTVDARLDGDTRTVTFAGGTVVRERLVACDDRAQRLCYTAIEGPLTHHNGVMEVVADGDHAVLVWTTDFLPDAAAPVVGGLMEQGGAAMQRALG